MKEKFIAFILFFFGVYYNILISFVKELKFSDELFILFFAGYLLIHYKEVLKERRALYFVIMISFLVCWGFLGSLIYHYQPIMISFWGSIVYFKSFIPFFFILFYAKSKPVNSDKLRAALQVHLSVSIAVIIMGIFYQLLFAGNSMDHLGHISLVSGFFNPPAAYGIVVSFLCIVFFYLNGRSRMFPYLFWALMVMLIISFRVKALFFAGFLVLFFFTRQRFITVKSVSVLAVCLILIFSNGTLRGLVRKKIHETFTSNEAVNPTARSMLYHKSIPVALDHFPFGAGFATYGTYFSQVNYSPLYDRYGLSRVHGLSRDNRSFMLDTQWPPILAETGIVGFLLYILLLFMLYKGVSDKLEDHDLQKRRSLWLCFILLLINSTSTQLFFNSDSAAIYILLGILTIQHGDQGSFPGYAPDEPEGRNRKQSSERIQEDIKTQK